MLLLMLLKDHWELRMDVRARIPTGQVGPVRGQGRWRKGTLWDRNHNVVGDSVETGAECSSRRDTERAPG